MKKVLIMLCVALLLATPVFFVQAEDAPVTEESLIAETKQLYKSCLYAAGRDTFHGMCGLATSYQLWKLGINDSLLVYDGNKQFDAYKNLTVTTGGHDVVAYSAEDHTLSEALNLICQNGTRTVRNILVGFQWTDTEAGAYYGHACVINAIQDGTIYFTESFDYAFGKWEGQTITCSIDAFVDFFDGWTTYEGCIYFGEKQYANTCQSYPTDLYVQLRFESNLRSQPSLLGENSCVRLRSLSAGEVLHATGVYVSGDGDLFYRIDDGGVVGYVSANAVHLLQRNEGVLFLEDAVVPARVNTGESPVLAGTVHTAGYPLTQLRLDVTDDRGNLCLQVMAENTEDGCDLSVLNEALGQQLLGDGSYTLILMADTEYPLVEDGELIMDKVSLELLRQPLLVGAPQTEETKEETPELKDGWFEENGIWYCYENGEPCTGWVTRIGVSYYLKEDGSVTTGWLEWEEGVSYFSSTGALCTGWVTTPEGTYYWLDSTARATGLTEIDGVQYYFGDDGRLFTGGTVTVEEQLYRICPDGAVIPAEE